MATLTGPSGLEMFVHTTTPGMQLYTGNWHEKIEGKQGTEYLQRGGICLEAQNYPNAIDVEPIHGLYKKGEIFILRPGGEPYTQKTVHMF